MIILDRVFGKKLIGFKENSITQFVLPTLRGDWAILLLLLFSINTLSFSQEIIEINTVREGYYKIFDADSTQIDQKATELEAMQGLTNYQFRSGKLGYYTPPNFRVDIKGNSTVEQIKIDTLTITGGWHMRGENGNFYRYPDCGEIIKIETDTTYSWQTDIELIRTQTFGKTEYKDTGIIPFQIREIKFREQTDVDTKVDLFLTEHPGHTKIFLDGVLYKEFQPGHFPKIGDIEYWGWFWISDLIKGRVYTLQIEVTSDDGAFNISKKIKFNIGTLPTEAPAQMSEAKVE